MHDNVKGPLGIVMHTLLEKDNVGLYHQHFKNNQDLLKLGTNMYPSLLARKNRYRKKNIYITLV